MSEKVDIKEIKPLDVWTIIETYFRDNPNYKVQHQIDSFIFVVTDLSLLAGFTV